MATLTDWTVGLTRRRLLWALGGLSIAAIGGCGRSGSTGGGGRSPLVTSILSEPKTFNYAINEESPNIFGITYEGLVEEDPETGKVEPALAAGWEMSENGQRIVVTLRSGLRWSDGAPLTADDVSFTFNEVFFNEAIPTGIRDVLRVGQSNALPQVKMLGPLQVEFSVPEPFAPFLRSLGVGILPAHRLRPTLKAKGTDGRPQFLTTWGVDTPPSQIVGNGPYRLKEYVTSQRLVFERNPYYWRKGPNNAPQPYIEEWVWQIVESQDTSLLQFRSGGLDSISVTADYFSLLKREEKRGNFTIYNAGPTLTTSFICFNLNKGKRDGKPLVDPVKSAWFNDLRFRQAVAYGIDRQTMIDSIFRGLGQLQHSPIASQSPYYLSPEQGLLTYGFNLERSRQLLTEAGFQNRNGELFDSAGNRVRFTLITNAGNKIREAMGAQIAQDLAKLGMKVDLQPIAFSSLVSKLSDSLDWECHLLGFTGGVEPHGGSNVWRVTGRLHAFNQTPDPGKQLVGQEFAPWELEIDRLYAQASQELDETKRRALYARTQQLTQQYLPFIHLITPYSLVAVRNTIQGLKVNALGGAFWNIHELRLDREA
ncbi:MAG: ABC transporter substrate-binding protein [Limnothrix sp. BL-A-16]